MKNRQLAVVALVGMGLFALTWSSPVNADENDGEETCASEYPNAPTEPPRGYDYESESDAYMAFRREARGAGYTAVKKTRREDVQSGPCVDHGEHVNMQGIRRPTKGKKPEWAQVGSLTSCDICEETRRGPRLYRTVWRIHPDY